MKEKTIEFKTLSLPFTIEEGVWQLKLAKSQTRIKDAGQTRMLTDTPGDQFVPVEVKEEGDAFNFSFLVDQNKKQWDDLHKLHRNDKLRLLCNLAQLKKYLTTRITFFLHPDNIVFDDNLLPFIIYRGIRDLIPPFEMSEQDFLKQLKCFSIALFSQKYTFDQLYHGALEKAEETEFERQVSGMTDLEQLITLLEDSYQDEQKKTEKTMQRVPIKRFRLFKRLAVTMIIVSVLLSVPLVYFGFVTLPFQSNLLDAHEAYLSSDYGEIISTLQNEDAEKLPQASKYVLAHSYINTEQLSDTDKNAIMNNVSLNSDENYLLYWIFNGRGKFEKAMEKAKYLDDPQLIMYGLIKQIEAAKNNPDLSGSERDEKVSSLQDELLEYREEYNLDVDENADEFGTDIDTNSTNGVQNTEEQNSNDAQNTEKQDSNGARDADEQNSNDTDN